MFFIMGIDPREKQIPYNELMICSQCGKYGRYEVVMRYMCFSFFFIPLIKWNKQFYVRTNCCGTIYALDPAIGRALMKGVELEFKPEHLQKISMSAGYGQQGGQSAKRCVSCGYQTNEDFLYCPKCGQLLK